MKGNLRIGEFLIEFQVNSITGAERTVHVEPKVMLVLACLAEHAGEVLTKETLIQSVWAGTFVTDDVLTRSISELRKVFGDDARESRFIQTIPRSGYRLIAPVCDLDEKPSEESKTRPLKGELAPGVAASAGLNRKRLTWLVSLAVLAIAAAGFFYRLTSRPRPLPTMNVRPFTSLRGQSMGPAFSPDGGHVAFVHTASEVGVGEVYVQLVSEGGPKQLTHSGAFNFSPVWSPDGQQIAFVRRGEQDADLRTISAYGDQERKLYTFREREVRVISWSPDGESLAFDEQTEQNPRSHAILLLSPETLETRPLTSPPEGYSDMTPCFSPDGSKVAFLRGSVAGDALDLYVVKKDGQLLQLTFGMKVLWNGLAWTDDNSIVFSSERTGAPALWKISANGGNAERLEISGNDSSEPAISRNGHWLAYMTMVPDYNIYRVDVADAKHPGSPPAPILESIRADGWAQFSPDGSRIAFMSNRSGVLIDIWVCNVDGSSCAQLSSKGAGSPRWSPDGKQIACDSMQDGKTSIYTIDRETHRMRALVEHPSDETEPSWSRTGDWVYFSAMTDGSSQIWKVPADGGKSEQVTRHEGRLAQESPDGRYVYFQKGVDAIEIWRIPVGGGEEDLVLDLSKQVQPANWAVVNDGIYFIRYESGGKEDGAILFFDFGTRKVKEIVNLGRRDHIWFWGLSVSSDRRSFLYTVWEHNTAGTQINLVENFH